MINPLDKFLPSLHPLIEPFGIDFEKDMMHQKKIVHPKYMVSTADRNPKASVAKSL